MKHLLITLLSCVAINAHAADDFCVAMGEMAKAVGEARDAGMPETHSLELVFALKNVTRAHRVYLLGVIGAVYKSTGVSPSDSERAVIDVCTQNEWAAKILAAGTQP